MSVVCSKSKRHWSRLVIIEDQYSHLVYHNTCIILFCNLFWLDWIVEVAKTLCTFKRPKKGFAFRPEVFTLLHREPFSHNVCILSTAPHCSLSGTFFWKTLLILSKYQKCPNAFEVTSQYTAHAKTECVVVYIWERKENAHVWLFQYSNKLFMKMDGWYINGSYLLVCEPPPLPDSVYSSSQGSRSL